MRPSSACSVHYNVHQVLAELRVWRKIAKMESFRGWNFRGPYRKIEYYVEYEAIAFSSQQRSISCKPIVFQLFQTRPSVGKVEMNHIQS
jgi:hypothetical protein